MAEMTFQGNDPGDPFNLSVKIENTGGREGEQEIRTVLGTQNDPFKQDHRRVQLESGETTGVGFAFETGPADSGTYSVEVISRNDLATTELTVPEVPYFEVEITEENSTLEITEGDPLRIAVVVTNAGSASGTPSEISVTVNEGFLSDTVTADDMSSLALGESTTLEFRLPTYWADAGEYIATVRGVDDEDMTTVTIEEAAPVEPPNGGANGGENGGEDPRRGR